MQQIQTTEMSLILVLKAEMKFISGVWSYDVMQVSFWDKIKSHANIT